MNEQFGFFGELYRMAEKKGPDLMDRAKVLGELLLDNRVPKKIRAIPAAAAVAAVWLYNHSDLIPDEVRTFGKLDNFVFAGLAMWVGLKALELLAPAEAVRDAKAKVQKDRQEREDTINGKTEGGDNVSKPKESTGLKFEVKE